MSGVDTSADLPAAAPSEQPESRRSIAGRLARLALPVSGTNALGMLMGLVDTIVVGHHSQQELAELALAWSLNGTSYVAVIGLLVGVSVLVSRRLGEDRRETIGRIWRRGMMWAALAGFGLALLINVAATWALEHLGQSPRLIEGAASAAHILAFSIVPFGIYMATAKMMEALSQPRWPLIVLAVANVLNLGLNLVLVPQMGADGSAWSTFISRVFCAVAIVVLALVLLDRRGLRLISPDPAGTDRSEVRQERREQVSIGFAALGSRVLEAASFNAMTIFAGQAGVTALAAFSIFMSCLSFGFMPAIGLATATVVTASHARGAGQMQTSLRAGWTGIGFGAAWGLVAAIIGLAFADPIAATFSREPDLIAAATLLIALAWIVTLTDYTQVVIAELLRALGATWFPTISHLASYIFVMMPLGWYLCVHLQRGARGLVEAIAIASLVSFTLLVLRWWRLSRQIRRENPAGGLAGGEGMRDEARTAHASEA